MITRTKTLEQIRPLTNAERLALYRLRSERAEVTNEYRRRYLRGVQYKLALHQGHPGKVTGIHGRSKDDTSSNVVWILRDTERETA